jgi:hypothetical protein
MSKRLNKEAFVQGHAGGSLLEIILIASVPAVLLLIVQLLAYTKNTRIIRIDYFLQFFLLVTPLITQMMGPLSPASVVGVLAAVALFLIGRNFQLLKRERSKVPLLAMR